MHCFQKKLNTSKFRKTKFNASENFVSNLGESKSKREYMKALDLVGAQLTRRFNQKGMKVAADRGALLIDGAN